MIGRTSAPNPTRMQLMQNVTRAVIAYDEARHSDGYGPRRMPVPERKPDGEPDDETDSDTY